MDKQDKSALALKETMLQMSAARQVSLCGYLLCPWLCFGCSCLTLLFVQWCGSAREYDNASAESAAVTEMLIDRNS